MTANQRLIRATVNRLCAELLRDVFEKRRDEILATDFPRDYIPNQTWTNKLEALFTREAVAERQHRKMAPEDYRHTYPVTAAAALMIIKFIGDGAQAESMPSALKMMTCRQTAIEAEVLGFMLKPFLSPEWVRSAVALDYVEAVRGRDE